MEAALIGVIDAEGKRQRELILREAEVQAERIRAEARTRAEQLARGTSAAPGPPAGDPRLAELRLRLLQLYHQRVDEVRRHARELLAQLDAPARLRLLARVTGEVLQGFPPGPCRISGPAGLRPLLEGGGVVPARIRLEWCDAPPEQGGRVRVEAVRAAVWAHFDLDGLAVRVVDAASAEVACRVLGDGPG